MPILGYKDINIIALASIILASCGGSTSKDPRENIKKVSGDYLKNVFSLDFDNARKAGTKNTDDLLNLCVTFTSLWDDSTKAEFKRVKTQIKEVQLSADSTTANVTYTESDKPGDQILHLVKAENKWLVDQSKESISAQSDMPASNTDEAMPANTDEAMPSLSDDSARAMLKDALKKVQ
jgi:hypothetical protein